MTDNELEEMISAYVLRLSITHSYVCYHIKLGHAETAGLFAAKLAHLGKLVLQ